jgi:hypothetical protein
MRLAFLFFIFTFIASAARAQSKDVLPDQNQPSSQGGATSLDPYYNNIKAVKGTKHKKAKKKSSGPTIESDKEYYARMERLVKEKRKEEKEMQKPQYSNPLYFGHKRPPVKHKRGKLKYCKECGIRH